MRMGILQGSRIGVCVSFRAWADGNGFPVNGKGHSPFAGMVVIPLRCDPEVVMKNLAC